jgi:type IV pilus assembly protein PilM
MGIKNIIFSRFYKKPQAFGLDISDSSIKIVQLKKKVSGYKLISYNRTDLPSGIIKDGEIQQEKELVKYIKQAIDETNGKKIKTNYAVCSLPEQHSFIKILQMPQMSMAELQNAIKWEAEANIPFPLDEVYIDWQIIEPVKNHLDHFDILINAVPKKIINQYVNVLHRAGIQPVVFETESFASITSLIKNEFSLKPILAMDLGFDRTSFSVFAGDSIRFTSSIPISNSQMITEIANKLNIDWKEAKILKLKIGLDSSRDGGKIFNILLPILTKLADEIKNCISFHDQHPEHEHGCSGNVSKIILFGGGANLSGLPEYLSSWLKIPVVLANPWINILPDIKGKTKLDKMPGIPYEESLGYSTVLGLAIRGTNLDQI